MKHPLHTCIDSDTLPCDACTITLDRNRCEAASRNQPDLETLRANLLAQWADDEAAS